MDDVIEILGSDTEDERDDELKNIFGYHMGRTISKQELFERINDEDDSEQEDYLELLREIQENDQIIPQPLVHEQYFVDLTTWPRTADNIEDALAKYNDIGLLQKIQFKKMSCRRDSSGFMTAFTLCCFKRATFRRDSSLKKGIKIKDSTLTHCPVKVGFKYNLKKECYIRTSRLIMHHDHPLEIYDRHFMRNGPIMEEIKLLANCKVPVCTIYNLVNKKFQQKIRYADVYKVCKDLLQDQGQLTESHTELDAYIEGLKEMKKQCKDTNYHFGGVYKNKQLIELDYIVVQNESMFMHSQSYSDMIYIDVSNGTNKHDMGLILFSGINQERQSIVLAYALIREDIYSNYYNVFGTFFNKFLQENNPKTVITDVNFEMARALQSVIPANTIHLFCQWHVKRYIKDRFYKFNVKDATNAQKMIYEMLMQCIFSANEEEFDEIQQYLFYDDSEEIFTTQDILFLRDLYACREKWAACHIPSNVFLASDSHNIVRAESMNQMISSRLFSDSTLCSLHRMISDIVETNDNKYSYENSRPAALKHIVKHPILKEISKKYSNYCFTEILNSYSLSFYLKAKVLDHDVFWTKYRISNSEDDQDFTDIVISQVDSLTCRIDCECLYPRRYQIFCEHALCLFNYIQLKSIRHIEDIMQRWIKPEVKPSPVHIFQAKNGQIEVNFDDQISDDEVPDFVIEESSDYRKGFMYWLEKNRVGRSGGGEGEVDGEGESEAEGEGDSGGEEEEEGEEEGDGEGEEEEKEEEEEREGEGEGKDEGEDEEEDEGEDSEASGMDAEREDEELGELGKFEKSDKPDRMGKSVGLDASTGSEESGESDEPSKPNESDELSESIEQSESGELGKSSESEKASASKEPVGSTESGESDKSSEQGQSNKSMESEESTRSDEPMKSDESMRSYQSDESTKSENTQISVKSDKLCKNIE